MLKKLRFIIAFWIVSLIILIIGLSDMNGTLDINIHDTYFVIPHFFGAIILSIVYFIYGFGYWLVQEIFKKRLVKILTLLHSVFLIGSFLAYWTVIYYSRLFTVNDFPAFDNYQTINITLVICTILCMIALPIYIINLSIGVFRKSV
ncbi:hypothetical protein [Flavobacterium sp. HJJ]|uniref:hypothetical protein n=1 Tax=Flavobacterium sp. HJJ TaxID=2783792 RepID=UPI00188AA943|nr:hypothetical protein [Flavobacterium sp. HJJ]MBF4471768.1 hypothetical protein [Flavobacterium sp. HJJ]